MTLYHSPAVPYESSTTPYKSGPLGQLPPFGDTIVENNDITGDYRTQLNTQSPAPHTVVYTTTTAVLTVLYDSANPYSSITTAYATGPSAGGDTSPLVVSPSGMVSTTGALQLGTYEVTGTWADAQGNVGTWAFILTVIAAFAPQTSVIPATSGPHALATSGIEVSVPFHIDPGTGGVAQAGDYYTLIEQHIESIILTYYGERVMLPRYGSNLQTLVFSQIDNQVNAITASDIKAEISKWESAANITSVRISSDFTNQFQGVLNVSVDYTVVPFDQVNTMVVATGGAVLQASTQ